MQDLPTTSESVRRGRRFAEVGRDPLIGLVVRRLVAAVFVLFFVTILVFLLIHAAPGGPENALLGRDATETQREAVREQYQLNDPLVTQYVSYLQSLLQLDLGDSLIVREPVSTVVWRAAWNVTIPLLAMSWFLAMTIGITL